MATRRSAYVAGCALWWAVLVTWPTPAAAQASTTASPGALCQGSSDPTYGYSQERPIQVGGVGYPGRQKRYLDALRGPKGETLSFERAGSTLHAGANGEETMLDLYTVKHEGLAKPVTLFLDWYHYTELFAPQGFTCGASLDLGVPPPDPIQAQQQVAALAAATAKARGFRAPPVPLGPDGAAGFVLDRFRLLSRRAGGGATPADHNSVVVVHPRQCDGRQVAPKSIVAVRQGREFPPLESFGDAKRLAALTPGSPVPPGSLAAAFQDDVPASGLDVKVTYAGPGCTDEPAEQGWPIELATPALLESPMPPRPAGDTSGVAWIAVQAIIDHHGAFQEARSLGGPDALAKAAIEAVGAWRVQPPRANGAPLTVAVVLIVSFIDKPPAFNE